MANENEPAPAGTDDAALFNDAVTNPPVEHPIEPEPPKPAEPPAPEPAVPAGRLREEADARRAAERERDEWRRRFDEQFARQPPPPKVEPPKRSDLFEKPSDFVREEVTPMLDPVQQRINEQNEYWSRQHNIMRYGDDKVQAAYTALQTAIRGGDAEAFEHYNNRIMKSIDPYGEIMRWHASREVMTTVGPDLNAYRQKLLDEALKDPEFQKRAFEHWRGQAASNGNTVNRPVVPKLPSIGKVGAAAPSTETEENLSDEELFHAATRRR
jgi:hypothetical protein